MKPGEMDLIQRRLADPDWMQAKVYDRIEKDDCWIWTGGLIRGYGQIYMGIALDGKSVTWYVHRLLFLAAGNELIRGMDLDHLCRQPKCSRPDHLEQVSHAENMFRAGRTVTACPRGHEYTEENTIYADKVNKRRRKCRTCYIAYQREIYWRRKRATA